jgi:polysaccharide deacetylase 2 family uncharacterized protein YibQ
MASGFLGGAVLGGIVGIGVLAAVSVVAPPPRPPEVADAAPGATQAPERAPETTGGEAAGPGDRAPVTGAAAPRAAAPAQDSVAFDDAVTAPAALPETGGGAPDVAALAPGAESGAVPMSGDAPVLPNPQALAPMAPGPADELSISTEPVQPPAPGVEGVEGAFDAPVLPEVEADQPAELAQAPEPPVISGAPAASAVPGQDLPAMIDETPAEEPRIAPASPQPSLVTQAPQAPEMPETAERPVTVEPPETGETVETADTAGTSETTETVETAELPETVEPVEMAETTQTTENTEPVETAELPESPETPEAADVPAAPEAAQTTQAPAAGPTPPVSVLPNTATQGTGRPAVGTPAGTLIDRADGVTVNRPGGADATVEGPAPEAEPTDPRPVVRYAADFKRTDDKPLMAVVLIDDGRAVTQGSAGLAALGGFPYPLSFAVDATRPDAAERIALYRDQGFEVLAMIDLPQGAQPADAETTFSVLLPAIDGAVGVLEGVGSGFQDTRPLSDQVTAILKDAGLGLVTQDKGLNTMPKLADKAGVPAAPVFRDFDGKGQTATVIRRFFDQAAFKAGQEGAVIMLGRLRPDTITALLQWGLQDRASQVTLAPVSAVLRRGE